MDSYKGVRDFYPEDERVRRYVMNAMRRTAELFGYEAYDASVLEATELYTIKSNAEMVAEETYTFTDRGDRSVTLRPEMTPSVARMVAARKRELGYPARWYSIPNLFRYDRPQRGRYREHWQLNADIFGVADQSADEELLVLADTVLKALGATGDMYTIRINDRNLLKQSIEGALKDQSKYLDAVRLIDKRDKLKPDEFATLWSELATQPLDECLKESTEVNTLIERVRARGVESAQFVPTIARGFDYYTGMVFEIFDTSTENASSLAGGGRYDTLVELYGSEPVPCVGFGMGVERVQLFLETHGLLPPLASSARLYLIPLIEATHVADTLRSKGLNVALGMKHDKVGDHLKAATKLGIRYAAVYGDDEAASGKLKIKNLVTGEEQILPIDDVPKACAG
ncbi:MAG: histidyl-tRNA synthetase [Candidatus Parcubacteria bacterium]|jgi:histidyl-tRNA synthetase